MTDLSDVKVPLYARSIAKISFHLADMYLTDPYTSIA